MKKFVAVGLSSAGLFISLCSFLYVFQTKSKIIGHRGGVVDSTYAENSLASLKEAYKRGYYMVEIDVRLTKDSQLITQHDPDFSKYFGISLKTNELTWKETKILRNNKDKSRPLLLEEVLEYCSGKLQVMMDNKITGNDTVSFKRMETLLKKYKLLDKAMFIGTEETRKYFLNKSNTGYNRKVIENMLANKDIDRNKIFLFAHGNVLTKSDIEWAKQYGIVVVPSINKFHYTTVPYMEGAAKDITNLQQWGVEFYQVDAEFDKWF